MVKVAPTFVIRNTTENWSLSKPNRAFKKYCKKRHYFITTTFLEREREGESCTIKKTLYPASAALLKKETEVASANIVLQITWKSL